MLLGIPQLARFLNLDWSTTRYLVEEGDVPAPVYIGHLARWRESDLTTWCAAGCPKGPALTEKEAAHLATAWREESEYMFELKQQRELNRN